MRAIPFVEARVSISRKFRRAELVAGKFVAQVGENLCICNETCARNTWDFDRKVGSPRLTDPLKRPAFRRLALSYAVNELGDWLGIIALSVLVFELTDSALATALLFIGTGFLPAFFTPVMVARLERPPPRFVLPAIYAAEAAAFAALALLSSHFSLAAVVAVAAADGALALTARTLTRAVSAEMLEPHGELRAGNAILNVAFTGGAALGPAIAGAVVGGAGRADGAAAERGLLLPDRLHPADHGPAAARAGTGGPPLGARAGGARLHPPPRLPASPDRRPGRRSSSSPP